MICTPLFGDLCDILGVMTRSILCPAGYDHKHKSWVKANKIQIDWSKNQSDYTKTYACTKTALHMDCCKIHPPQST